MILFSEKVLPLRCNRNGGGGKKKKDKETSKYLSTHTKQTNKQRNKMETKTCLWVSPFGGLLCKVSKMKKIVSVWSG